MARITGLSALVALAACASLPPSSTTSTTPTTTPQMYPVAPGTTLPGEPDWVLAGTALLVLEWQGSPALAVRDEEDQGTDTEGYAPEVGITRFVPFPPSSASLQTSAAAVLTNDGNGTSADCNATVLNQVVDIDGDGAPEIVYSGAAYPTSFWGDLSCTEATLVWNSYGSKLCDANDDAVLDDCSSKGLTYGPLADTDPVAPFPLDVVFRDAGEINVGLLAHGDIDGDATLDLVLLQPDSPSLPAPGPTLFALRTPLTPGEHDVRTEAFVTWQADGSLAGSYSRYGVPDPVLRADTDLDGDGRVDIIGSMPLAFGDGAVWLWIEPVGGDFRAAAATRIAGTPALTAFGGSLEISDLDGDGQADLAIGAADHVTVWLGPLAPVDATAEDATAIWTGLAPGDGFGASLAAGDLDADGRLDLAVGAPTADDLADDAGRVHILWSAGL